MLYERTAVSKKPEAVVRAEIAALRDEELPRNHGHPAHASRR